MVGHTHQKLLNLVTTYSNDRKKYQTFVSRFHRIYFGQPVLEFAGIFHVCSSPVQFEIHGINESRYLHKGRNFRDNWTQTRKCFSQTQYSHCLFMCDTKGSTCLLWDIATEKSGLCCYAVRITQNTYVKK